MSRSMRLYPPEVRPIFQWLLEAGKILGLDPQVSSTVRSREEQQKLYASWLRGENKYPVAKPGTSLHERGYAIDIVCRDPALLGWVWRTYIGGRWSPSDAVHFDLQPYL